MNNKKIFDLYSFERELDKSILIYENKNIIDNLPTLLNITEETKELESTTLYFLNNNKVERHSYLKTLSGIFINNEIFYKKINEEELYVNFKKNILIYQNNNFLIKLKRDEDYKEKEIIIKNKNYSLIEHIRKENEKSLNVNINNENLVIFNNVLKKISNWSISFDKYNSYNSNAMVLKNNEDGIISQILMNPERDSISVVINESYLKRLSNFNLETKGISKSTNSSYGFIITYNDYKKMIENNKEQIELYEISNDIKIITNPILYGNDIFSFLLSRKKMEMISELSEILNVKISEDKIDNFFDKSLIDLINNEKGYHKINKKEIEIKKFNFNDELEEFIKDINEKLDNFENKILDDNKLSKKIIKTLKNKNKKAIIN